MLKPCLHICYIMFSPMFVYTQVNTNDDTNKAQKNVGVTQQCWNKNLTKDDTNKVQKNVGMTQQCWNKNLTKDNTNKVLNLHV